MSNPFDFDRRLTAWLDEQAPASEPRDLADVALSRTRRTRQRPGWATLERWIPMETRYKFGAVPRTALILAILGVMLALVSAIAVGQQPSPKLPAPFGVARNGLIAFDDGGDIYVVNPDGSGRKALTSGPDGDYGPEWSDDGTQIAYWSQPQPFSPAGPSGTFAIKVMDADGRNPHTLVDGVTQPPVSWKMSWSHDGRSLAYADRLADGPTKVDRIMVIPVAGGDPVELVSPGQAPTWSPDDRLIAYQSGGVGRDHRTVVQGLSVIGADGTGQHVVDGALTTNPWAYAYPQWSQDGQELAYHAEAPGKVADIRVTAIDGSGTRLIGDPTQNRVWPVWSPDESHIAYSSGTGPGSVYQLAIVDPDGSNDTVLQHPPLACNCAFKWSPDGTKLIAYQDGPLVDGAVKNELLLVIDVSGKEPVQTTELATPISADMSWQRLAP